jgi:hypothetical protein
MSTNHGLTENLTISQKAKIIDTKFTLFLEEYAIQRPIVLLKRPKNFTQMHAEKKQLLFLNV